MWPSQFPPPCPLPSSSPFSACSLPTSYPPVLALGLQQLPFLASSHWSYSACTVTDWSLVRQRQDAGHLSDDIHEFRTRRDDDLRIRRLPFSFSALTTLFIVSWTSLGGSISFNSVLTIATPNSVSLLNVESRAPLILSRSLFADFSVSVPMIRAATFDSSTPASQSCTTTIVHDVCLPPMIATPSIDLRLVEPASAPRSASQTPCGTGVRPSCRWRKQPG